MTSSIILRGIALLAVAAVIGCAGEVSSPEAPRSVPVTSSTIIATQQRSLMSWDCQGTFDTIYKYPPLDTLTETEVTTMLNNGWSSSSLSSSMNVAAMCRTSSGDTIIRCGTLYPSTVLLTHSSPTITYVVQAKGSGGVVVWTTVVE